MTSSPLVARPEPPLSLEERALLPCACVASGAAAGVHAAMVPAHVDHQALIALFFAVSAFVQIGWAGCLLLRASRRWLVAGTAVNVAFIALWALTRTIGLPVVVTRPEPVGAWDVACVLWELVVVGVCLWLLGSGRPPARLAPWHRWDGRVVLFALGSAAALAALSFSGLSV